MDYHNTTLKRELSKGKLSPRSEMGNLNMSVAIEKDQVDIDNSIMLDSQRKPKTLKSQMKIKDKLASK
jgi:hypothetical protein